MPYTHCGCPLPGETIGQKLSRVVQRYRQQPSHLQPPEHQELFAATHPSDHNAVYAFHHRPESTEARKRREAKVKMRRQRDLKQLKSGKIDPRVVTRGDAHDPAFLLPIPLFYYFPALSNCAAVPGNVIDGDGGGGCVSVSSYLSEKISSEYILVVWRIVWYEWCGLRW